MKKNMKKLLEASLAASMVLGMNIPAFAATTDESTKTFTKTYESIGEDAVSPEETFSFENIRFVSAEQTGVGYSEEWATSNLPTISTVIYGKGVAGSENKTKTFEVTLPVNYPTVGIYTYSFKEVDNNVEGVDYNDTTMLLKVTVVEDGGYKRVAAIHCEGADGTVKTGEFSNTYSAGKLSVKKVVEGNMGDQDKEFEITVTFTASDDDIVKSDITYTDGDDTEETTIEAGEGWTTKTVKIYLDHGETIVFNNIPAGVKYAVEETDLANKANADATDTYTATYVGETGTITANATAEATVTNTKTVEVDTGISLDNMPYIMVLALVALGLVGFVSKKRSMEF